MYESVKQYVREQNMLTESDHVIAGISGGADSICLLCVLIKLKQEYGFNITAVHLNHGLRGAEADRDEQFVKEFCKERDIPFKAYHIHVGEEAKQKGISEEEAGRLARRKVLEETARLLGGTKIALAHHMNDNVETLFLNIARGTGLRGLGGMLPVNGVYIRPLLCVKRADIEAYLAKNNIEYCIDQTNFHDTYTRNRVRRHVIPYMEHEVNEGLVEHAGELMSRMQELYTFVETQVAAWADTCVESEGGGLLVKEQQFMQVPEELRPYLLQRVLKQISEKERDIEAVHVNLLAQLFEKQVGKSLNLPYAVTAVREYAGVRLCRGTGDAWGTRAGKRAEIQCRVFDCLGMPDRFPENNYTKWFDYDIIKNSLVVRNRCEGDRIEIDSKGGSQKIKKYFINRKIPEKMRDNIWLVADGNDILWIVGYRQSRKYQVSEHTKRILEIRIDGGEANGRINQSISAGKGSGREN